VADVNIHASCVRLGKAGKPFGGPPDCGLLLLGASGAGKSDLVLRLIAMGAELVADDRTELFVSRGKLFARPPTRSAGLLEVRGVGILALPHAARVAVTLVARLGKAEERLPEPRRWRGPAALGLSAKAAPAVVSVAAFEASAPAKLAVAAAAAALGLHRFTANPI
jgi:HPr kinase/phosphorylase